MVYISCCWLSPWCIFFASYESAKSVLPDNLGAAKSMIAASFGETIVFNTIPTENVKQKMQAGLYKTTSETLTAIRMHQVVGQTFIPAIGLPCYVKYHFRSFSSLYGKV